ncbi:hypothetical protein [Cereibacter sphaeroides]|nr:hypothetical protein [Cereibacter sphaeroides]MCE6969874.1 hypothetical protein [Cereibacter sphaeroides]
MASASHACGSVPLSLPARYSRDALPPDRTDWHLAEKQVTFADLDR